MTAWEKRSAGGKATYVVGYVLACLLVVHAALLACVLVGRFAEPYLRWLVG